MSLRGKIPTQVDRVAAGDVPSSATTVLSPVLAKPNDYYVVPRTGEHIRVLDTVENWHSRGVTLEVEVERGCFGTTSEELLSLDPLILAEPTEV